MFKEPLVAVEFDVYLATILGITTLRLCSGSRPLTATISGTRVQYAPFLTVPILIGSSLSVDQPGQSSRGQSNAGEIRFGLPDEILPWINLPYVWPGHVFRVYHGEASAGYAGLSLVFTGRINNLACDFVRGIATVSTTDGRHDLDKPLMPYLYDDTTPSWLKGRPKPQVWGRVGAIEPDLVDAANLTYLVSVAALSDINQLSVGGIYWTKVGFNPPGPGQYWVSPANGTLILGSSPAGTEIRVVAELANWNTFYTGDLVSSFVYRAGSTPDLASLAQLNWDAPQPVGYYVSSKGSINIEDALDEVMSGIGGWWNANELTGNITAGIIKAPDSVTTINYDETNIYSCQLVEIIRPVWRLRVECLRIWEPETTFFTGANLDVQAAFMSPGTVAPPYQYDGVLSIVPGAVDAPLIRSFTNTLEDAIAIRDRLSACWGVERRLYDLEVVDDAPPLYSTVGVTFRGVSGKYRVVSRVQKIGGGTTQLRLWG